MSIYDENQLLRILRSFGEINLEYFNSRLRFQKLGYLAQEMGADGGFPYSWYLRGPYSSSLSNTLFMGVEVDAFKENVPLKESDKKIVSRLTNLLGKGIDKPDTLELFASVWYLMPSRKMSGNDVDSTVEIMKAHKPQYTPNQVKDAIKKISEFRY